MIRLSFSIILVALTFTVEAQYLSATINDEDGFTNLRSEPAGTSQVITKFLDGDIFEINPDDLYEKKNWVYVGAHNSNNHDKCKYLSARGKSGYIHISRIMPLSKLSGETDRKQTNDQVQLSSKNLNATINIRWLTNDENKALYNNGCIWGTDMGNPKNVITNVELKVNEQAILVPTEDFSDLYAATLKNAHLKTFNDYSFIVMSNSDGAGFYEVTWVFKGNKYIKRYIAGPL